MNLEIGLRRIYRLEVVYRWINESEAATSNPIKPDLKKDIEIIMEPKIKVYG